MKRVPSNRMPKYGEPDGSALGYLFLAAFIGLLGYVAWLIPWYVTAGVVAVGLVIGRIEQFRQNRIASERVGESLCSFARSFDCRSIDTWVIRAVYEQVSPLVAFPIRKSDRFDKELDLMYEFNEVAEEIAERTGRPLDSCEQNPWYGKVVTLEDVVMFFTCQPKKPVG